MSCSNDVGEPSDSDRVIDVYCMDCDEITRHTIDTFGSDEWWTCEECLQPWMRVRPDDRLGSMPAQLRESDDCSVDYDPFIDVDDAPDLPLCLGCDDIEGDAGEPPDMWLDC